MNLSDPARNLFELVVYADMYDFALKESEVLGFWGLPEEALYDRHVYEYMDKKHGYIALKGRRGIFKHTEKVRKTARKKIQKAKEILEPLSKVKGVKMVGLSGSIGAMNARKKDDYDVFVITDLGTKWRVRLSEIYLHGLVYRNRAFANDYNRDNKVCCNVYIEDNNLRVPKRKRNLFVAYQSVLVKPLWGEDIYHDFLYSNQWIKDYFEYMKFPGEKERKKKKRSKKVDKNGFWDKASELLAANLQRVKIVSSGHDLDKIEIGSGLYFHPQDPTENTVTEFNIRMSELFS